MSLQGDIPSFSILKMLKGVKGYLSNVWDIPTVVMGESAPIGKFPLPSRSSATQKFGLPFTFAPRDICDQGR